MDCSFLFPNAGGELVTISFEEACQGSHSIFTHGRGHGRYCGGLGGRGFAGGHWGEGSHSPNVEGCQKKMQRWQARLRIGFGRWRLATQ